MVGQLQCQLTAGDVAAGSPEKLYYLRDVLGSVVGLSKAEDQAASGQQSQLVERNVYDPYGRTIIESWNAGTSQWVRVDQSAYGNPWMWTGQRYDAGVGLYHFVFRSYSPELGRWLQRDPLEYVNGVSLFEYVASAPLCAIDPFGLEGWWQGFVNVVTASVGGAIGGGISGGIAGFVTPPFNPGGAVAGIIAGAIVGGTAGFVSQIVHEFVSGYGFPNNPQDSMAGAFGRGFLNGLVAGILPGAIAGAQVFGAEVTATLVWRASAAGGVVQFAITSVMRDPITGIITGIAHVVVTCGGGVLALSPTTGTASEWKEALLVWLLQLDVSIFTQVIDDTCGEIIENW